MDDLERLRKLKESRHNVDINALAEQYVNEAIEDLEHTIKYGEPDSFFDSGKVNIFDEDLGSENAKRISDIVSQKLRQKGFIVKVNHSCYYTITISLPN